MAEAMRRLHIRDEIYIAAIEAGLIVQEDVERLILFHERQSIHPVTVLLEAGVAEDSLYQVLAERSGLPLDPDPVPAAADAKAPISAEHLAYFDAIPVEADGAAFTVASWRWDKRNVIPAALANLAGAPVSLVLVTPSAFARLRSRE